MKTDWHNSELSPSEMTLEAVMEQASYRCSPADPTQTFRSVEAAEEAVMNVCYVVLTLKRSL